MGTYRIGISAAIMGFMLLGGAATQIASAAVAEQEVVVRFGDLDLATTAGAEKLYRRIESAAQQVCPQAAPLDQQRHRIARHCVEEAMAHAVSSISSEQLAAVYAQHTHHLGHSTV